MKRLQPLLAALLCVLLPACAPCAKAQSFPGPKDGDWIAPSFTFHNGKTLSDVRLHYITIGDPKNPAVLILHGTFQTGHDMLTPSFAGVLFGRGQPLDASRYFIILPDGLGIGESTKPSDALRTKFPEYDYADMVSAQYRMVTEGLGIHHLRLVMGFSMGGMQTWLWGEKHPTMMDGLVPMACQPTQLSGRNWMMRRMFVESVRQDPAWNDGNYNRQPPSFRLARIIFAIATNGGAMAYEALAPTREKADKAIDTLLAATVRADANDYIYQLAAAADYNPELELDQIKAPLLAIDSADDERDPPEISTMHSSLKKMKRARFLLIAESATTHGHSTEMHAAFYDQQLRRFMKNTTPR